MAAPKTFKIGLVQMRCSADPQDNLTRARARIVEAADRGATLVCLPELFRSQYFCQIEDHANFDLAEPIRVLVRPGLSGFRGFMKAFALGAGLWDRSALGCSISGLGPVGQHWRGAGEAVAGFGDVVDLLAAGVPADHHEGAGDRVTSIVSGESMKTMTSTPSRNSRER